MSTVNIKQLAQELNLSISTVSRALNDKYDVSPETKKKVRELAGKLNYQPNPYASSLRKHKSKTIAVVVPELANNFFTLAIKGIQSVASEAGYHVLIYVTNEDYQIESDIFNHMQSGRVDGVIVSISSNTINRDHLWKVKRDGLPLVFFDRVCDEFDSPKVTTDDYNSGFKATQHLIDNGCKKIAYLLISKNLSIGVNRMQGYLDALKKNNLHPKEELIVDCGVDKDENYSQITKLLSGRQRPDGIFASVESLAITSYHVCRNLKLSIPKEVKIISFSNLETATLLDPSLTTITQPAFNIGKEAATILCKALTKKSFKLSDTKLILPATLNSRDSTAI